MAQVIAVGKPANDSERRAIAYLRDHLPSTFTILHNFEITHQKEIFEIDLAILAPHCVFIVDVKGTFGKVDISGSKWYPEGRQPFQSPLAKLRQHARIIKAIICDSQPHRRELNQIYVHAAVLMTAPDSQVIDHDGQDGKDVIALAKSVIYFKSKNHIPSKFSSDIAVLLPIVRDAIKGKAQPMSDVICFREWRVEEKLGGTDHYTEYRASHIYVGKQGGAARLRVYQVDPYQEQDERNTDINLISNAFRSANHMPPHENIVTVREFFPTEDEERFVLVTDDIAGESLRQHLERPDLALTYDQKIRVIEDVLAGLAHANAHQVVHRNLSPDAIILGLDGRARITGFEYARKGERKRSNTIATEIVDDIDLHFQALECFKEPSAASHRSDLFSAGIIFYRLLTGEMPFESVEQALDSSAIFLVKASQIQPNLPFGLDDWLQKLCSFHAEDRFENADEALNAFRAALSQPSNESPSGGKKLPSPALADLDLESLPRDFVINNRFTIEERLGKPGGFAVAYKVFDSLGEIRRVLKLVTRDRKSVLQRLSREYRTLQNLPEHKHVVKVVWADVFAELDQTPYIVFEYLDGQTIEEFIETKALSTEDALSIALQVLDGLAHLHRNGVYHHDIKPSNILWTSFGVKIIDFNIAVTDMDDGEGTGGTRRYIPPDFDLYSESTSEENADRDRYALAITFYECVTGQYPFEQAAHSARSTPRDPNTIPGFERISPVWINFFQKALAPNRHHRFVDTQSMQVAIQSLPPLMDLATDTPSATTVVRENFRTDEPNYNPFVSHLLTLYSQSQLTNAGTRGLDIIGEATYVPTLLDTQLAPAILAGEFNLVIISGNAGDGKTAFIQKLEKELETEYAIHIDHGLNGSSFTHNGRKFITNYDGSQDEGDKQNENVLLDFFAPFAGMEERQWQGEETRIIAINEGRLVDFLHAQRTQFTHLAEIVEAGLHGDNIASTAIVLNLNLRSVVANIGNQENSSIFDRMLTSVISPKYWGVCSACDLADKCYVFHNIQTFQDPIAGPKIFDRLKMLFLIVHLRGRLHITLRDLRSALSYILVGTRDCEQIHTLYTSGAVAVDDILDGFYFNACQGGTRGSEDRLIALLREIGLGESDTPEEDRWYIMFPPNVRALTRFSFTHRNRYDEQVLEKLYQDLPNDFSDKTAASCYFINHRNFVIQLRRRQYFERRDEEWISMLPYRQIEQFQKMVGAPAALVEQTTWVLKAINRGEGITDTQPIQHKLALRVSNVEKGSIRSYRVFGQEQFELVRTDIGSASRFLEFLPPGLILKCLTEAGNIAELRITLDVYEMLAKLLEGFIPSVEEKEGLYQSLTIFKNVLSSAPYQEVLLTEAGFEFYQMTRESQGVIEIQRLAGEEKR